MFDPKSIVFFFALGGLMWFCTRRSTAGGGLAAPEVNPPSIREGSVRVSSGRRRTRYFVGGGFHGGK